MGGIASQITSLTIVYSTVYSDADERKHQSFASLAFVRGIHRGPVNSPHKWPITRKMFPFDDVIMSHHAAHERHTIACPCGRGTRCLVSSKFNWSFTFEVIVFNVLYCTAVYRQCVFLYIPYHEKCAHSSHFFVFWCGFVLVKFTHIVQGCFNGAGPIARLPQCQWSNPDEYRYFILGRHEKMSSCTGSTPNANYERNASWVEAWFRIKDLWISETLLPPTAMSSVLNFRRKCTYQSPKKWWYERNKTNRTQTWTYFMWYSVFPFPIIVSIIRTVVIEAVSYCQGTKGIGFCILYKSVAYRCMDGSEGNYTCKFNRPISQIPQCICPVSRNAPFKTEMCAFIFWMLLYEIWDGYIVSLWDSRYTGNTGPVSLTGNPGLPAIPWSPQQWYQSKSFGIIPVSTPDGPREMWQ